MSRFVDGRSSCTIHDVADKRIRHDFIRASVIWRQRVVDTLRIKAGNVLFGTNPSAVFDFTTWMRAEYPRSFASSESMYAPK